MRTVAVFFGGKSCENEISVLTGVFVLNLLDRSKYTPFPVYIDTDGLTYSSSQMSDLTLFKNGEWSKCPRVCFEAGCAYQIVRGKKLKRLCKIDVAINCCHGGLGEGGGVSALAAWNGIPLASTGIAPSAVFMDKTLTKTVMQALGVPTVDYIRVNETDYKKRGAFLLKSIEARLQYPVIVKPAHLGSSIGIATAANEREVKTAIENAFALDTQVIIERYLQDKIDVNCAACMLNGEICVSNAEPSFGQGVYTFEEKYVNRKSDSTSLKTRNDKGMYALTKEVKEKIRQYTKTVYRRMNMTGVVRMDFLVSGNKAYLCEVNTTPGSLAYYMFCERITDARAFFGDLIEEAVRSAKREEKYIPKAGILAKVNWLKKK